jgi:hypothetical protein
LYRGIYASIFLRWPIFHFCSAIKTNGYVEWNYLGSVFDGAGGDGNEQFQQMQQAIGVIRQVIEQGIENKLDRENLLDHIKEVLGDYRQLRKTEYGETINNYLIRVCSSELSLELGEREMVETVLLTWRRVGQSGMGNCTGRQSGVGPGQYDGTRVLQHGYESDVRDWRHPWYRRRDQGVLHVDSWR